jgi:chromosome segregation ATPase
MRMNARSGYSVGNALQQALQGIQASAQECFTAITQLDQDTGELVERRSEALIELAEHYLPAIDEQSVANSFREVRSQLMDVLTRKQRHVRELKKTLDDDHAETRQLEQDLEQVTDKLNNHVTRREELEQQVARRLESDAEFQRLSKEALIAEKELDRNEHRVDEIKKEAAEKLPSFDESSLFSYLHKRGYGTSGYNKKGLTKKLDGWVAKMINYPRARRSYEFLRVTPELMANEVTRRRDQFNALMELVEACEDRHADEVGLTAVMREGQELGTKRDALVAEISKQQDLTDKHREELVALDSVRSQYYEQGVARVKQFLETLEARRLQATSQSTPEPQDDQIVAELVWIGEELDRTKREGSELAAEQDVLKSRLLQLQDIWQRFRRADFDSGRSFFHPNFDIEGSLEQFARGQMSRDDLWASIKSAQQFAPPWYEDKGQHRGRGYEGDFSQVLLRVLTEIAGEALRRTAERGMERRSKLRKMFRRESGRPDFRGGGFTKGRGF